MYTIGSNYYSQFCQIIHIFKITLTPIIYLTVYFFPHIEGTLVFKENEREKIKEKKKDLWATISKYKGYYKCREAPKSKRYFLIHTVQVFFIYIYIYLFQVPPAEKTL